ncbi:MAG: hypothetical protein M4579_006149 [Chaenotheca gracillima]|nr:MAG: hypothetical protein M4579_006149 [Chaenotheca gracillima]
MATQISRSALRPARGERLKFGTKQMFLPNFTLTFLRTPFLPANYASFIVPLSLNKLDIKDYLYHAYDVRVISVRSYVQQQRVVQDNPRFKLRAPRRWFRPRSIKKMTVEMDSPFVWPPEPEDFTPWDQERYRRVEEEQKAERDAMMPDTPKKTPERDTIAKQAKRLLKQQEEWKPQWEDIGEAMEVEKDVTIPS